MASTTLKGALAGMVALAGLAAGAEAQSQGKLSDKSVHTLMEYAWQILPSKFTTPDGKVIEVDKSKREGNIVPVENGRDIIRVAYSSAQAQVCELWEEQQANYDTLMRREIVKKKWTDQQLLYITTLHRMTIHAVAGKLRVEEKDGDLKVFLEPIKPGEGKCSDEQKTKIRESILAYVNLDAPPEKEAAATKKAPAAPKKK
ncbi:MAG: hypothetical protein ACK4TL_09700 [Hyphomicrobiaceae bacterium]